MEIAIAFVVLSLVVFTVFVLAVVRGVRATRRGIDRARREVRRAVTDVSLSARAVQPGVLGEVARTRKELRTSVDSTRSTLLAGADRDPALREALALLDQLSGHAERLDGELASMMTGEPDRARVSARLPELRGRVERIKASADSLRMAAQDRAHHDNVEGLDALQEQIAIESKALRHWSPSEQPRSAPGPASRPAFEEGKAGRDGDRKAVEDAD
ncbi:hypothetical protein [Streptomyces sp. SBT349]|uniref:hypothetical protein n=1 Tax=Streptomyces sp. SBT349 TaxID=1580539 RepID=UPI0007C64062|nr:hypothetical protein [Streptomyces sp. SBT349]